MTEQLWFVAVGLLLVLMALTGTVLKRLPLSSSLIYLFAGWALAQVPGMRFAPERQGPLVQRLAELALIVSLFCAGLKMRLPLRDRRWRLPIRLASLAMVITIGVLAVGLRLAFGVPWGVAVLVAAILAPTDPVLAADVQVEHAADTDQLRFGLTGEAGLNDGTTLPFVLLGMFILRGEPFSEWGLRWLLRDTVYGLFAGVGIGWLLGSAVGMLVLYLRKTHREAVGLDDFLAIGLIALTYGVTQLAHGYGFLAVFAAGLALRRIEARASPGEELPSDEVLASGPEAEAATAPSTAGAFMARAVLGFAEQLERMGEAALMLIVGGMLAAVGFSGRGALVAAALFLGVRPLSVALASLGTDSSAGQRRLMAWFGIRGIGSVYYLFFVLQHGIGTAHRLELTRLVVTVVALSALVHGISVTPLMNWYARRRRDPSASTLHLVQPRD